jgi:hypothetical protein
MDLEGQSVIQGSVAFRLVEPRRLGHGESGTGCYLAKRARLLVQMAGRVGPFFSGIGVRPINETYMTAKGIS